MGNRLYQLVFVPALLAGLFMGAYLRTGQSIEPTDLILSVGDKVVEQAGETSSNYWEGMKFIFLIGSIGLVIIDIIAIIVAGWPSIFVAVLTYVGATLMFAGYFGTFGIWPIIIAQIFCLLTPDKK